MPSHPTRIGTMQVVDMNTGQVVSEKRNAMTLLPPSADVCQECAVEHDHDQPHNQQSMYYRMHFHARHGRYPNWSDAMAHCTPELQAAWREELIKVMKEHGMPVPDDLLQGPAAGR